MGDALEGSLKNNYQYNDKELWDDGDLNWLDYGFRNYDAQIGRFVQLDPLTWHYPELTNYQYASCDPITNIDIDGLEGTIATFATKEAANTAMKSFTTTVNDIGNVTVKATKKAIGQAGKQVLQKSLKNLLFTLAVQTLNVADKTYQHKQNGIIRIGHGKDWWAPGDQSGTVQDDGYIIHGYNQYNDVSRGFPKAGKRSIYIDAEFIGFMAGLRQNGYETFEKGKDFNEKWKITEALERGANGAEAVDKGKEGIEGLVNSLKTNTTNTPANQYNVSEPVFDTIKMNQTRNVIKYPNGNKSYTSAKDTTVKGVNGAPDTIRHVKYKTPNK
ncbi:MAG: hypothetical protein JST29_01450 [Bacteroidetes bacterium]|nr:hypothetical protein [Bacteroidota bacterium]